jgi:membrane protein implicated in regulation of membrane protease activity
MQFRKNIPHSKKVRQKKTYLCKKIRSSIVKTNIEAIIGERCVVTEKIDNYIGCGQVKIKGQIWSARGVGDDDVFESGEILHVVAIEGVKVICKK